MPTDNIQGAGASPPDPTIGDLPTEDLKPGHPIREIGQSPAGTPRGEGGADPRVVDPGVVDPGVIDPGREGDQFVTVPPRGMVEPDDSNTVEGPSLFAGLFRSGTPRERGSASHHATSSFFPPGSQLTARGGNENYTVTVLQGAQGKLILVDADGAFFDVNVFLYDTEEKIAGLWIEGKLYANGEYGFCDDSHFLIDRLKRRIIGEVTRIDEGNLLIFGKLSEIGFPRTISFEGHSHTVSDEGILSKDRKPLQPSLALFVQNFPEGYNEEAQLITLTNPESGISVIIDLDIAGLPHCKMQSVPVGRGFYAITLIWGEQFRLEIKYNPNTGSLSTNNFWNITDRGAKHARGGSEKPTAAGFKDVIDAFTSRARNFVDTPGGGSLHPEESAPDLGDGGGFDNAILASYLVGDQLLPPLVKRNMPKRQESLALDEGTILILATNKFPVAPGVFRYAELGGKEKEKSIATWEDLKAFIRGVLDNAQDGNKLEVVVDQYYFSTLTPPPQFLADVTAETLNHPSKHLTLVIKGHPIDPAGIYRFTSDGVHVSSLEMDKKAIGFWETELIREEIQSYLSAHESQKALFEALLKADGEIPWADLGAYLKRVIEIYNNAVTDETQKIPNDHLTLIYSKLEELSRGIHSAVLQTVNAFPLETPPSALYWNPVETFRRKHPANTSPGNSWLSVGAGQMIATLEFPRKLMNRGFLPLDFRLLAVDTFDKGFPLVWEINTLGTNKVGLPDTPVNPQGDLPIYVLTDRQRDEALLTYQPEVILLNLKAGAFTEALSSEFVSLLALFKPVLATPCKAYDGQGNLPYMEAYRKLKQLSPEMADDFSVIGGFFAAPQILEGTKVDITIAGGSLPALRILARGLSPENPQSPRNRADWKYLNLKLIPRVEIAAALMAGGANKNFLTYRSGRLLLKAALALPSSASQVEQAKVDIILRGDEKRKYPGQGTTNLNLGEEITARIAPFYGIATDPFWSPNGLEEDFRNCLPQNVTALLEVRGRIESILREGNLNALKELIEKIRGTRLAGETRNARDGYMDEIIHWTYHVLKLASLIRNNRNEEGETLITKLKEGPLFEPLELFGLGNDYIHGLYSFARELALSTTPLVEMDSYESFWNSVYPDNWKGTKAQEGRNGIGPLIRFAQKSQIPLPPEVYEAWQLYNPGSILTVPPEQTRPYTPPTREELVSREGWNIPEKYVSAAYNDANSDEKVHETWGFPRPWVKALGYYIVWLNRTLTTRVLVTESAPNVELVKASLKKIERILSPLQNTDGKYPEVTRRLIVIRQQIQGLIHLFSENQISTERNQKAVVAFSKTIEQVEIIFRANFKDVSKLLAHLIRVAQNLFRVELEIAEELGIELGLKPDPVLVSPRQTLDEPPPALQHETPQAVPLGSGTTPPDVEDSPTYPPPVEENKGPTNMLGPHDHEGGLRRGVHEFMGISSLADAGEPMVIGANALKVEKLEDVEPLRLLPVAANDNLYKIEKEDDEIMETSETEEEGGADEEGRMDHSNVIPFIRNTNLLPQASLAANRMGKVIPFRGATLFVR